MPAWTAAPRSPTNCPIKALSLFMSIAIASSLIGKRHNSSSTRADTNRRDAGDELRPTARVDNLHFPREHQNYRPFPVFILLNLELNFRASTSTDDNRISRIWNCRSGGVVRGHAVSFH